MENVAKEEMATLAKHILKLNTIIIYYINTSSLHTVEKENWHNVYMNVGS